jgi:serine protease AprX
VLGGLVAGTLVAACVAAFPLAGTAAASTTTAQYIVADQAAGDATAALSDVVRLGGSVVENLGAASAVLANLTPLQVTLLQALPTVSVTPDLTVSMSALPADTSAATRAPAAVFPQQTGATSLWSQGDSGAGVNVAVLDTGIDPLPDFAGRLLPGVDLSGEGDPTHDSYGHGTFVAGLIAGNGAASGGAYKGEAPGAGLVPVKVAGASGSTDLATVIQGVGWVIAHHTSEHIGVLNMSLGFQPTESTLVNPLDQAVERAWEAGVVVVTAAGNSGPQDGTVLSPGDDPLVLTVGAVDDQGTATRSDDTMASFSSAGPTDPDGWFKPDLVTSGRSVVSLRDPGSTVDTQNPSAVIGSGNFVGSGTSFSSAITSGAVALLLADHPMDSPDNVKAALLGTTDPGPVGNPFVDGHGLLDVAAADAAPPGAHLDQKFGQVVTSLPAGAPSVAISPQSTVRVGFTLTMPAKHLLATSWLSGGELDIPVSCSSNGSPVGDVQVTVPGTAYTLLAGSLLSLPLAGTYEGSANAPDLCSGGSLHPTAAYGSQAAFTGTLISSDTTDPVTVQVRYAIGSGTPTKLPPTTVTPVAVTQPGATVNLSHWSGMPAPAGSSTSGSATGLAWDGSAWNGSAWSGSAWSGSHWSGSQWSGSHWSGSAWDGSHWSGSHWSGSAWNGQSWGPGAGG